MDLKTWHYCVVQIATIRNLYKRIGTKIMTGGYIDVFDTHPNDNAA